jgi:hypothetical protein
VPIGRHANGPLELDLDRLLAGRLLIQGSSGVGKSRTLRRIVEEAFDFVTVALVDSEGEFENLARHIGAETLRGAELAADGLTAAAARSRAHRLALHLDLTDLDSDQRITKAAAFFAGLIGPTRGRAPGSLTSPWWGWHERRPVAYLVELAPCPEAAPDRGPPLRQAAFRADA